MSQQSQPTASSTPPAALDARLKRLSAVIVLGMIMSILDTTIVIVAVDTLARKFHTSLSTIQWVSTGYLLALSMVIPLTGWAIERFGAKRMWLLSLTLFLVGSALCGAAWSVGSLIAFRVLQGLGGGMIMPIGMSVLASEAGPRRMGRVMSIIGVPALVAPVLGPVIGGLLVTDLSWRWIFYVNVPIGLIALYAAWRVLEHDPSTSRPSLDLGGFALLSPGLVLAVYALAEVGTTGGFSSPQVLVTGPIGLALIAAFAVRSLRVADPLLDLRLLSTRSFAVANLTSFLLGGILFGTMFVLPLYFQIVRGDSALHAGLILAPQGLGTMASVALSGRIVDRSGAGRVVPVGVVLVILGSLVFTGVGVHTSSLLLIGALVVRGLGMGLSMMPTMSSAYLDLQRTQVPRATTVLNIMQRVGGSVGTALFAVVLQRDGGEIARGGPQASQLVGVAHAFDHTFWWVVGSCVLALAASFLLPRRGVEHATGEGAGSQPQEAELASLEAMA